MSIAIPRAHPVYKIIGTRSHLSARGSGVRRRSAGNDCVLRCPVPNYFGCDSQTLHKTSDTGYGKPREKGNTPSSIQQISPRAVSWSPTQGVLLVDQFDFG